MSTLLNPYFGEFGGMYVPQILMPALRQLEEAFVSAQKDPAFQAEFTDLLKNYAGRPTALTKCRNLTEGTRTTLYLKREDLLHGGAHKTNQVLGQALLAKRMGKTEIIAETGAGQHGAPLKHGRVGIYFGMKSPMMQTADGQIEESYSISAGLDFPSVGPQHAFLNSTGRADYVSITDDEALDAFKALSRHEGIIPALESSHALAHALKMMRENPEKEQLLVVNLSGRGDKDIFTVHDILKARGEI
ncbi:hypothetical protein ACHA0A_003479 [Klebsiella pneumoniae]